MLYDYYYKLQWNIMILFYYECKIIIWIQNNYTYTKTKVMTIETKVMDTIFDIVILTQLVHSEPI